MIAARPIRFSNGTYALVRRRARVARATLEKVDWLCASMRRTPPRPESLKNVVGDLGGGGIQPRRSKMRGVKVIHPPTPLNAPRGEDFGSGRSNISRHA